MYLSVKQLNEKEAEICRKTLSARAVFAMTGDALARGAGFSIVRMGDGEAAILEAPDGVPFERFSAKEPGWNARLGIEGLPVEQVKENIKAAAKECSLFAPSVSGISLKAFSLHHHFDNRDHYADNFFVNDWTPAMIGLLLGEADGAFILHKDPDEIIRSFSETYGLPASKFEGFRKLNARDNEEAIAAASASRKRLVLFSAGPAGKMIGPRIARAGKVVLDVGNTLPGWSKGVTRA
jgi:hypothetical protein